MKFWPCSSSFLQKTNQVLIFCRSILCIFKGLRWFFSLICTIIDVLFSYLKIHGLIKLAKNIQTSLHLSAKQRFSQTVSWPPTSLEFVHLCSRPHVHPGGWLETWIKVSMKESLILKPKISSHHHSLSIS